MTNFEAQEKGLRRKIGLHAWSVGGGQVEIDVLAERYQVDAQTVRDCKHATQSLHKRMVEQHGPRYFTDWGLERKPEGVFLAFGIGPSMREMEAEAARKRRQ